MSTRPADIAAFIVRTHGWPAADRDRSFFLQFGRIEGDDEVRAVGFELGKRLLAMMDEYDRELEARAKATASVIAEIEAEQAKLKAQRARLAAAVAAERKRLFG